MATRRTEALKLVARVRRLGGRWRVEQLDREGGAYKILCPDGSRVNVHLTPSDVNHLAVVERALNRHGFAEAEAEFERLEERRRKAATASALAANERLGAQQAKRAATLTQAAGPYGAEQPTIAEVLADHVAPRVWLCVRVDEEMARAFLERNTHNRRPSAAETRDWATKLRTGRAHHTHQGVAFDVLGRLVDGQTRLQAIVETKVPADMMVSVGWPAENFAVVDSGRRRTAAQVLNMEGAAQAALAAGIARLCFLAGVWGPSLLDHSSDRVGNDVIAEVYGKLDEAHIAFAVSAALRLRHETKCGPTGPGAALYLIAQHVPGGAANARVVKFAQDLIYGVGDSEDPVYAVRRTLIRHPGRRIQPPTSMALVIKGWNARIEGRRGRGLVVREGSSMPTVLVPAED